jgi:hypothetical protein
MAIKTYEAFRAPSPYEQERLRAERQRRYAELLEKQAMEQEGEFTYQGIRAMPSPAAALGKLLSAYQSKKARDKAEEAEARQIGMEQEAAGQIAGRLTGREIVPAAPAAPVAPPDAFGLQEVQSAAPAFRADMQRRIGEEKNIYQRNAEEQAQLKAGDIQEVTRQSQYVYDPEGAMQRAMTPQGGAAIKGNPVLAAMLQKTMETPAAEEFYAPTETAGGLVQYGKRGGRKTTIDKAAPKAPDLPGDVQSYQFYVQQEKDAGRTPKPFEAFKMSQRPTTYINTGQKTVDAYTTELSKGLADQDLASIAAGDQAIPQIEMSETVRNLLKQNPITGTGAEARLGFERALATAGFSKGERASATENLMAVLAKTTLAAIPTSGLGSGAGFTGTDREFLEKAAAGKKEMSAANLQFLAELNDKVARANLARSNVTRKRVRQMPNFSGIPGVLPDIVAPPAYGTILPSGATLDRPR